MLVSLFCLPLGSFISVKIARREKVNARAFISIWSERGYKYHPVRRRRGMVPAPKLNPKKARCLASRGQTQRIDRSGDHAYQSRRLKRRA